MSTERAPVVGDLLALARGPMYRVLDVTATDEPGVYQLDGYEIHSTEHGPELRPRKLRWPDNTSIVLEHDS